MANEHNLVYVFETTTENLTHRALSAAARMGWRFGRNLADIS